MGLDDVFEVARGADVVTRAIDVYKRQISTKGIMIDYITDSRLEELFDCSYDALAAGDYARSTMQLLNRLESFLADGIQEGSFRYDKATGKRLTGLYNALTSGELLVAVLAGIGVAPVSYTHLHLRRCGPY